MNTIMEPRISIITLGVKDMRRSILFYRDGLGFETNAGDDAGWAIFKTSGTRFCLYPFKKLAEDINRDFNPPIPMFSGITLAHNTRTKNMVDRVLTLAREAGGNIVKPAQDAFWGGYSGYFTDPDGYYWEVAWSDSWVFDEAGQLLSLIHI